MVGENAVPSHEDQGDDQDDLEDLSREIEESISSPASWDDPLEELWTEVQMKRTPKAKRPKGPSISAQVEAAAQKFRQLYSNPDNWTRKRGVALVDLETGTLIGNFSEYLHNSDPHARKLIREHQPIAVEATELINGYLGAEVEARIKYVSCDAEHPLTVAVQLDELMVESPEVGLIIRTRFGGIIRADLTAETQFASGSGNLILRFAAGTNIWEACSTDTKIRIRKGIEG